mmetsp:Transcript_13347/g.43619  ORF Transcript_13347/g.43619 Transcript_13347/m.43619 type:complete len:609 (+) Transcript_13347:29-1855(+)
MLPRAAAGRRERKRSSLPVLLALLLALSLCYTVVVVVRTRRHSAVVDSRAAAIQEASDAEAELSRQIEGFEQQHSEWARSAAGRVTLGDSGYRPLRSKRTTDHQAAAGPGPDGTPADPEPTAELSGGPGVQPGAGSCSSDPGKGCMPSPAVIVMSHNRADMLQRSLGQLCGMRMRRQFAIYVSEDTGRQELTEVASAAGCVAEVLHYRQPASVRLKGGFDGTGFAKIARHFGAALRAVLDSRPSGRGHSHAVVVEDDLLLSPDALLYFWSTAWLLEHDPSLWCVSAWNDQGYPHVVSDPSSLGRTDFFPGLGWMITGRLWREELAGKWPAKASTGWDHWMRLSSVSLGRECIRPDVPRTRHASPSGTNVKDNKPFEAFAFERTGVHTFGELHGLLRPMYDAMLGRLLAAPTHKWPGPVRLTMTGSAIPWLQGLAAGETLVLTYTRETYRRVASALGLWKESPRGTHNGTIVLRTPAQATLILADERKCPWLVPSMALAPMDGFVETPALPGVSCDGACAGQRGVDGQPMRCDTTQLEFSHTCEALARAFACEAGCGHQVGAELPAYVHDRSLDTFQQCLVSDISLATCDAAYAKTSRLCRCVPARHDR